MPAGWSWWTGHLLVLQRHLNSLPADANVYLAMQHLVEAHSDTDMFLFDFWPAFDQVLMISSPEASMQVSNKYNLPKPLSQHKSMAPIVGGPSLISMNNEDWKFWRALLNPGFSAANMLDRVPDMVDSVQVFYDKLLSKSDGGIFSLDEIATQLTMDIIMKVTLYEVALNLTFLLANDIVGIPISTTSCLRTFWHMPSVPFWHGIHSGIRASCSIHFGRSYNGTMVVSWIHSYRRRYSNDS
jgi:hypothetical protein